jgi:hypothetical protein
MRNEIDTFGLIEGGQLINTKEGSETIDLD